MNDKEYIEVFEIVSNLQNEFLTEKEKVSIISRENAIKIDELEQQIDTCRRNDDIDFRVFSPRNISIDNSDKIQAFENEKSLLEREKKEADKQIIYYTNKADKLSRVLSILKNNLDYSEDIDSVINSEETIEEKVIVENNNADDIFKELIDSSNEDEKASDINGIPVEDVERVCHKVEFTEKIVNNDRMRAKFELKEIISEMKELINVYK